MRLKILKISTSILLVSCASSTGPCTPAERSAIGAKYIAALEAACDRGKPLSDCAAAPAITKRYEEERASWVLCSRK